MFVDAVKLSPGTVVVGDICVIGAGAAGITLARDLVAGSRRVVVLESGKFDFDEAANDLNAGRSIGRPYLDLAACRQRFFGGTTNHWGGWCLPQEPIDFERGWPISRSELDPFYRRAQDILQLGPFDYRAANWGVGGAPAPFAGPHFTVKMLQNSPPTRFRETFGPELRKSDRVSVYLNATVTRISTTPGEDRVEELRVAALGGQEFTVRASAYVLACGGIENARLLLESDGTGWATRHSLVGTSWCICNAPAELSPLPIHTVISASTPM